jgi:peptide/nickel transport system substrate-binding protein
VTRPGRRPGLLRAAAWPTRLAVLVALACAGTTVGGGLAGAASTPTSVPWVAGLGGTMTIGIDQAPNGCNPDTAAGDTWADRIVLEPVLPSAFVVNDDDQAVYDSAIITQAELQNTSPETVVYTINPKAKWSDGTPITAADFVYTWEQERGVTGPVGLVTPLGAVSPQATTTLPGATGTTGPSVGYRQIASVTGSNGGRTVTVVFKTPYADWESLFDDLMPAHVLEKSGWDPTCTTVDPSIDLSGGPFEISKVDPGHEVVLVRNPHWWGQTVDLARLVIKFASGPGQLDRWLANGTVDVALPRDYDEQYLEAVTSQASVVTQSQVSSTFLQLEFSTTSATTSSVDVRQAIAHAIDRQSLVDSVVGWADSTIVPADSHIYAQSQSGYPGPKPPPLQVSGQPNYSPPATSKSSPSATAFPATADLSTTDRLLTGVGDVKTVDGSWVLADGKPLTVRLAVDEGDAWAAQTGPLVARQLEAAGIAVTVVQASSAQAAGMDLASDVADVALLPMHSSPYPSQAIAWYTPLLGSPGVNGSQDWSNLDDATLNSLLVKASQELNPVDASPLYSQADTLLWQDMAALPLFAEPSVLAWSGQTADVNPNPNGANLLWSPETWAIRVPPTSPDTAPS